MGFFATGGHSERRDSDVPLVRITAAEESDIKQTGGLFHKLLIFAKQI